MNREEIERTIELLEESKEEKWNKDSFDRINEKCPFCYDAYKKKYSFLAITKDDFDVYRSQCYYCLCPPSICADAAEKGYIAELYELYLDGRVCDMYSKDLDHMINLFDEEIAKYKEMLKKYE